MKQDVVNPEVVSTTRPAIVSLMQKPGVKYTLLAVSGAIGVYALGKLGKFVYDKVKAKRNGTPSDAVEAESPEDNNQPAGENPNA